MINFSHSTVLSVMLVNMFIWYICFSFSCHCFKLVALPWNKIYNLFCNFLDWNGPGFLLLFMDLKISLAEGCQIMHAMRSMRFGEAQSTVNRLWIIQHEWANTAVAYRTETVKLWWRKKAGGLSGQMERGRCCPYEDGCPIPSVSCLCHMNKKLQAKHLSSSQLLPQGVQMLGNLNPSFTGRRNDIFPLCRSHFQSWRHYGLCTIRCCGGKGCLIITVYTQIEVPYLIEDPIKLKGYGILYVVNDINMPLLWKING